MHEAVAIDHNAVRETPLDLWGELRPAIVEPIAILSLTDDYGFGFGDEEAGSDARGGQ
jgi:hypothetical protein